MVSGVGSLCELNMRRGVVIIVASLVAAGLPIAALGATNEANLAARLAKLERSLESRGLVDLLQQVESLQQEVGRLRGQIEEQTHTIEQLRESQRATYVDLDQRLQGVEQRSTGAAIIVPETAEPPLTTVTPAGADAVAGTPHSSLRIETQSDVDATDYSTDTLPSDALPSDESPIVVPRVVGTPPPLAEPKITVDNEASNAAYRDSFNLLKAGQYDESIIAFSDFLQRYPNSQYVDNAQYWLGETHYVKRQFDTAIVEYRKLIETYPTSMKRSHAMLKIGYSYHELGQADEARAVLEDLRNGYAGTTAARLAEERIQRILAEKPQP